LGESLSRLAHVDSHKPGRTRTSAGGTAVPGRQAWVSSAMGGSPAGAAHRAARGRETISQAPDSRKRGGCPSLGSQRLGLRVSCPCRSLHSLLPNVFIWPKNTLYLSIDLVFVLCYSDKCNRALFEIFQVTFPAESRSHWPFSLSPSFSHSCELPLPATHLF